MRLTFLTFLLTFLLLGAPLLAQPQSVIAPHGVVNAASNIAAGFANQGIARGSLFVVFGNYLGPDTLVQAGSYPLPSAEGLAGTRVHIDANGYTGYAFMVYTSSTQVAAILPSNAPEGDATLTVNYSNYLTAAPVVVHIVRSAFGIFTFNQGGSGPAVVQNFVAANQTPVNTLVAAAAPGQTVILWGTGLGPANGDEASGPLPGALSFLDALYVGGQPAKVRYAGRSGCCAAVDQIVFDIPAGITGCYVPVAAVTGGVVSNLGTIAIANSGSVCDDPLSFRASRLAALQGTGRLRVGQIAVTHQAGSGTDAGTASLIGNFLSYTPQTLMTAGAVTPSLGTCYATESVVAPVPATAAQADALNAGAMIQTVGPGISLMASNISPGAYFGNASPANLFAGGYTISSPGGPDVGAIQTSFSVPSPGQWTNLSDFSTALVATGRPFTFRWSGADPTGYVNIQLSSRNVTLASSIVCNAPAAAGTFTVPAYLTGLLLQGEGSVSVGFAGAPAAFSAQGLDAGIIGSTATSVLPVNFQTPAASQGQ